jgi:hypothetical protein
MAWAAAAQQWWPHPKAYDGGVFDPDNGSCAELMLACSLAFSLAWATMMMAWVAQKIGLRLGVDITAAFDHY